MDNIALIDKINLENHKKINKHDTHKIRKIDKCDYTHLWDKCVKL